MNISPFYLGLGRVIRESRVMAGKSRQQAAAELGISLQQIQKYESGANRIALDGFVRLAAAYGTTAAEILKDISPNEVRAPVPDHSSMHVRAFDAFRRLTELQQQKFTQLMEAIVKHQAMFSTDRPTEN
jgi:transcriptional regulator with XRE-family HTH domain